MLSVIEKKPHKSGGISNFGYLSNTSNLSKFGDSCSYKNWLKKQVFCMNEMHLWN